MEAMIVRRAKCIGAPIKGHANDELVLWAAERVPQSAAVILLVNRDYFVGISFHRDLNQQKLNRHPI